MCQLFAHQPQRDYESQTRSLRIDGHSTSIRLEMAFWDTLEEIASKVDALIVTRGEHGSQIYHGGSIEEIPPVQAERVLDPTGCGDAFRGGLLYGIENGLGWATAGRLASLMGALKIEYQGPQNYAPTRAQINERFKKAFGYELPN